MMKKIILIQATLCCLYSFCEGQGIINNYLFGYFGPDRGVMNFPGNIPNIYQDNSLKIKMHYTHTNISDTAGNLLMYTNGVVMMDGNHDTMPNGKGLNPCNYTTQSQYDGLSISQADLILPDPGNNSRYYLIHQSMNDWSNYINHDLYFSKIDITLNNNLGDIMLKNVMLLQDSLWSGGTTACKHANGRDWWVVVLRAHIPVYFVFLLSASGFTLNSVQTIGTRYDYGQTAFSMDGNYYGIREFRKNFQVFDFDRCTGFFSNPRIVQTNDSNVSSGICFSPDSKLVYASSAHYLYQANLDSANLTAGTQLVATWDSTYDPVFGPPVEAGFEFMQIGPDGKIYMTTQWATHYMHCINYPDSLGVGCDLQQHSLLLPTYNGNTIPNFVNYFLGPVVGSVCDSLGLGVPENALHYFKFSIQPNPLAEKVLHCKYVLPQTASGGKAGVLEVLDLTGRILVKEPLPEWSTEQHIKLNVTAGLYLVRITSNHQQSVKKICVK